MKKKNIIIISIVFLLLLISVIALALSQKNKKTVAANKVADYYEVIDNTGAMFKGISVISDEQRIFVENMLTIEELHIKDKSEVKMGDKILTYYNDSIQEQIDSLELQYDSANNKLNRASDNKNKITLEINKKEEAINDKNNKLNNFNSIEKTELQQEIAIEQQELQVLKSSLQGEDSTFTALKDSLNDLKGQIESLKTKLRKEVVANIDGIVYINKDGLTNPSVQYITIISKEPLVKGSATEYDVLDLKIGQEMVLKILSTGEKIKGTITSIDDLPSMSSNGTAVVYNFNIKPENNIRIGFSVEIKENIDTLEIPKEYVDKDNEKLIVAKVKDNGLERIEVNGTLDSDYYIISSDKIKSGDKLSISPLEALKEE